MSRLGFIRQGNRHQTRLLHLCGRAALSPIALALFLIGCAAGGSTDAGKDNHVAVLSGAGLSDTIQAPLPQPLVVEAFENGQPRAGIVVQFAALPSTQPVRSPEKTALFSRAAGGPYSSEHADSTDAEGHVTVFVALGTVAGDVRIAVTVPSLGVSDTARYVVRPGAPASIAITVRDTALLANAQYKIGATVLDRMKNARPETPTFTSLSALGSVDAAGNVQLSTTIGRGVVAVRAGAISDTAAFVVVPPDLIVTAQNGTNIAVRLDGSSRRVWQPGQGAYLGSVLSPSGDLLAYSAPVNGISSSVFVLGRDGTSRRIAPANMEYANGQRFSRDGQWVYFSTSAEIWRVRIDGSQPEKLFGGPSGVGVNFRDAAPSPGANLIVYFDDVPKELFIHDRTTGQSRKLGVPLALSPVFSPDGTRIAYNDVGRIGMVNVDGTGAVLFGCPSTSCNGVGWTKDGQWLLTQSATQFAMTNVSTRGWITIPGLWGSYGIRVQE